MSTRGSGARLLLAAAILLGSVGGVSAIGTSDAVPQVSVYTHRHYEVDQMIFDSFTELSGIRVNIVSASADELIQRLIAEGEQTRADLLITVDAGRLHRAKAADLLQRITSVTLETRVPEHLRDPEGYWFGLTKRARVIATSIERVAEGSIRRYEDLSAPEWRGRVAVRSSSNIYNQSLVVSMIAAHGIESAKAWASGLVDNLAREPKGNDRDQMKAIAAGVADVALVNTYYVGLLLTSDSVEERRVAEGVRIVFPNTVDRGTHVNVSGAGVTAFAPNRENAIRLLEYMISDESQAAYAAANFEYPVVSDVPPSKIVAAWGSFVEDILPLTELGRLNSDAVRLMDEVGWK